ncbi:putative salicylate hydroxylase [Podospora fimiseda]|uniref:Salicylate hydroxylase n=1 Tax=Podospora fimiseda TaxID=252190 RepID=A0AAN7GWU6_9PEZI|nr:putative salicylate hydroxylase [Podospora fimiseda]
MSSPPEINLALIGAGITSLTLSIALSQLNIKHAIYEQSTHLTELGAGLGFGPNAWRALQLIDPRLSEIFHRVGTFAGKASTLQHQEKPVWIEFLPGTSTLPAYSVPPSFIVYATHGRGHAAVHRAKWLDILASLVTAPIVFRKRFEGLSQSPDDVTIYFSDGSSATHSGVIGCDGVKSKVRTAIFPESRCAYSGKYAYRALVPLEEGQRLLGEARAGVSSLWMGPGAHLLTFPVLDKLNIVAFVTDSNPEWSSSTSLTVPITKQDAIDDFRKAGFSDAVLELLDTIPGEFKLNKWGLFDLADNPLPVFYQGRAMVIGDAAHASTPHHGAGAGFCMEDVAVLKGLFEEFLGLGLGPKQVEAVFAEFDTIRRERDQWLVQSSRRVADLYELRLDGMGLEEAKNDIEQRQEICWGFDVEEAVREGKKDLRERLKHF